MKNKKGFTLMEMMAVVLIIAGFAAIAYPAYTRSINRARVAEAFSLAEIVREAQQRNLVVNGDYFTKFSTSHATGRTRIIKANDVSVPQGGGNLTRGLYTVSIANVTGDNAVTSGCIIVRYGPNIANPIFTIYTHVEDSRIWCEGGDGICGSIRSLEDINTLDCSAGN